MNTPLLTTQNLRKSFGDIRAVRGVDLQIARGEIFGLLGPNGAGKTTLINMLAGLLSPDSGKITLDGADFSPRSRALKSKIGLVPQELALYPTLSGHDNLLFFGRIYGLRGKQLKQRVDDVLEMVNLSERAKDPVQTYSGGMKRRINIAAGLLHHPEILFLDEPTVGVDPQSRNAIFEAVESLNREGLAILYTTHYMEEAERLCHRVAIMDSGQIIALDSPKGLIRRAGSGVLRLGLSAEEGYPPLEARLTRIPGVNAVSRRDGSLFVEAEHPQTALVSVLEAAAALNVHIQSLQILEPNLETVFLQLTGKSLRD